MVNLEFAHGAEWYNPIRAVTYIRLKGDPVSNMYTVHLNINDI